MGCNEFRAKYADFSKLPLGREVFETDEWDKWRQHGLECRECGDWGLQQRVIERGFDPSDFPCIHIAEQVTQPCVDHTDPTDCPDVLIQHNERFDEYSIAKHYGDSFVIRFCPWCGVALPESKRDRWFEELSELGYDDPVSQDIPSQYMTAQWHQRANF